MNSEKIKALELVFDAIEEIERAKSEDGLSNDQLRALEDALVRLWNIEQAVIKKTGNDLITALNGDAQALNVLVSEIQQSAASLQNVSNAIGKAANIVGALVNVLTALASGGF